MTTSNAAVIVPRPGAKTSDPIEIIPAPHLDEFAQSFGPILPTTSYHKTDKGRIAYYKLTPLRPSTGEVPDRVLLVHGIQTPALGLLPLARELQKAFPSTDFVLLDVYGHGLSDTPLVPHTPEIFHQLIDSLLDHLNWPRVHLLGFSFGGSTVISYTAKRPDRVTSLVAVAPAGLLRLADFTASQQAHLRGASNDEIAAQKFVQEWLEDGELVVPSDWRERTQRGEIVPQALRDWENRFHRGHRASVLSIFCHGGVLERDEDVERAAALGKPTIVILGELDDVVSKDELLGKGYASVEVVAKATHELVRSHASEVAGHVSKFWNGLQK